MRAATLVAILAAALAPAVLAQQPQVTGAVQTSPGKASMVQAVKATATVESVDAATRSVTVKLPKGETRTFVASDEVRNFDQIKAGDRITVRYLESLTLELKKDGKQIVGRTENATLVRSQPGEKPGGGAAAEVTAVADVVAVDAKNKKVSVKDEKGQVVVLNIKDPEQLKLIKAGDQIQATYTTALAVSLEPAAPAKK